MSKAEENTGAPSAEPAVHADAAPPSVGSDSNSDSGSGSGSLTVAGREDPRPDLAAQPTNGAAAPVAIPETPPADVADAAYAAFEAPELSSEEAERFASRIRASWEPASPVAAAVAERARSVNPAVVTVPDVDFDIGAAGAFPGAAQRKRGLLIASSAIVGFFALVALAVAMGTRGVTSPHAAVEQANKIAQSSEHAAAVAAPTRAPAAPAAPLAAAPAAAPDPEPSAGEPIGATPEQPVADVATAVPGAPVEPGEPNAAIAAVAPTGNTAASPTPAAAERSPAADEVEKPAADTPARAAGLVAGAELAENREPATVHVDIATSPADAQLTIDGERVTNPFETRAPKGGRHRVLAEAPGHRPRDLTLDFNRDQHLDIRLERLAAKKPAPTHARATSNSAHRTQPAAPNAQPKGAGFVSESPY